MPKKNAHLEGFEDMTTTACQDFIAAAQDAEAMKEEQKRESRASSTHCREWDCSQVVGCSAVLARVARLTTTSNAVA